MTTFGTIMRKPPAAMRVLRLTEVKERTGLSRTTLYTMMAEGRFPKPFKLNLRTNGWITEDIDNWIEGRIAERDA